MKPGPLGAESYSQDQRGLQEAQLCVERDNPRSMRNSCHPGYFEDWVLDRGRQGVSCLPQRSHGQRQSVRMSCLYVCWVSKIFFQQILCSSKIFFPFTKAFLTMIVSLPAEKVWSLINSNVGLFCTFFGDTARGDLMPLNLCFLEPRTVPS